MKNGQSADSEPDENDADAKLEIQWCLSRAQEMFPQYIDLDRTASFWDHDDDGEPPDFSEEIGSLKDDDQPQVDAIADMMAAVMADESIGLLREQIAWTMAKMASLSPERVTGKGHLLDWAHKLETALRNDEESLSVLRSKIEASGG